MRNFTMIFGWSLVVLTISGCATPGGIHRMAASMGTTVQTYRLPDDFVMPPFPQIECGLDEASLEEIVTDPFLEIED
jgi:hypothetical protein